jgi:hypothetical protein
MEDNINFDNRTKCNNAYYEKIIEFTDSLRNIENINSLYEFYRLFINYNFLDVLVENKNSYSNYLFEKLSKKKGTTSCERFKYTNTSEMEVFLGIYLLMHTLNLPKFQDHWDENPLHRTPVKDLFPIWRFESLLSFLLFSKPGNKKMDKIIDFINYINEISKFYYYPGWDVTIDERMISFRGRSELRKYEPSKPTKWGFIHIYCVTL